MPFIVDPLVILVVIGLAFGVFASNKEIRQKIANIPGKVLGVMTIGYPSVKYYRAPPRPPFRIKGVS